ncbi:YfhO family protein [Enterococcus sp. AZ192]|uniref:YfhO family protein n=1 Tax=unclassified Enterococcus TaxID=2608891 RepID=UPI003D29956E
MKNTVRKWLQENSFYLLLSILLPMAIMALAYYFIGIYPGSERTVMASDSFSQYSNFHASFNNVLHGKQNIFYTWFGSLGLNYWAFSAYYLNGIFTPLVFFFDNQAMPDALYVITLIKFGAMGAAFWFFSTQTFKLPKWLHVSFSTTYALMAYTTAYSEVIMWLDAFVYLPLIILGIHRVMDKRKPTLLFISYLLLFLSNFYMAFMIGVFSFMYYCVRLLTDYQRYKKSIVPYLIPSFLAGGASMVTILPTVIDLKNNGESLSDFSSFWQPDTGPWDLITKSMAGVYDTSKFGSAPFIYIGLLPLIFCLFYFIDKKVALRNKLLYGSLFLILIASVYVANLNLFWHGLHAPNMFLYRFSFLFSFLTILLAGHSIEKFERTDVEKIVNVILLLLVVFLSAYFFANKQRYDYIQPMAFIITLVLLVCYLILLLIYKGNKLKRILPVLFAMLMIFEAGFNTKLMIEGIKEEWGYAGRKVYDAHYEDIKTLVEKTKSENDGFYRLENLDPISRNDSFNYGYSSVTMFSSIRNRHSSSYLNSLGFRSTGSNLNISYSNNTLVMDSLLGVKYNLSKQKGVEKYGFKKIASKGEYRLYENSNTLPLGILTDKKIYKENAVGDQTELIKHLSGMKEDLFSFGSVKVDKLENLVLESSGESLVYAKENVTELSSITWTVEVPAKTQAYLSLVAADQSMMAKADVILEVNGTTRRSSIVESGQYYDLGYYETAKTVKVKTSFDSPNAKIALYQPDTALLNVDRFETSLDRIKEKGVDFDVSGRKASAEVDLAEDQVVWTTIPYDKGWKAYIDGKRVDIPTFKEAFLTLPVSKGVHTIEFVFLPQGFVIGVSLFGICILLFLLYLFWLKREANKMDWSIKE